MIAAVLYGLTTLILPFSESLMFSQQELFDIEQAKKRDTLDLSSYSASVVETSQTNESLDLICNGILFISPNQWTVWINQQDYHHLGSIIEGPVIKEVTADFVRIEHQNEERILRPSEQKANTIQKTKENRPNMNRRGRKFENGSRSGTK